MERKNMNFSSEDITKLLSSKEAAALAAILRNMDQTTLSKAAALAKQGNSEEAKRILNPVIQDPRVQNLLKQMEGRNG